MRRRNDCRSLVIRGRLDTPVSALLLPLFFALTGMRTQLGLLNGKFALLWSGIVLLAAAFGKNCRRRHGGTLDWLAVARRDCVGRTIEYARAG
jgi:hypothetical protein